MFSELVEFRLSCRSVSFLKILIFFYGIRLRHSSQLHKPLYSVAELKIYKGIVFSYSYHRSAFHNNCIIKFSLTNFNLIFFYQYKFMMNINHFKVIHRKILSCCITNIFLISAH